VVLRDGRVVEEGTPAELLETDGAFSLLFGDEIIAA
jgi:ABC-type multidrug transport system fused ATPase/permease subunit